MAGGDIGSGGAIPARICSPLGECCKGGTIPARRIVQRGDYTRKENFAKGGPYSQGESFTRGISGAGESFPQGISNHAELRSRTDEFQLQTVIGSHESEML